MKSLEEKACLCALSKIFGFKPKVALALIEHMGCASDIFKLAGNDLNALLGPHSNYRNMITQASIDSAMEEIERLTYKGIRFIGWSEEEYPEILKECPDPPVGLYIKGCTPVEKLWKNDKNIAVVGTRDISSYGREWCSRIIKGLSECKEKPLIVSGLALGTDICAHRAAVEFGLPTIGVMATGIDEVYPFRHIEFAEQMCHTPGCALITDYPPGTAPLAIHFLRRNRIIAGLSHATLLTESKIKGGGMMTARLAFSYNRDVYALPGRVDDTCSQGCNLLIRSKIAEPIISVDDLIVSLGMNETKKGIQRDRAAILYDKYHNRLGVENTSELISVMKTIENCRDITIEEIADSVGTEYSKVAGLVSILETDSLIKVDLLQRCSIIIGKNR